LYACGSDGMFLGSGGKMLVGNIGIASKGGIVV